MKKIKEFILREIADEYILIPTGSTTEEFNGIINITETAAFIWNHVESVNSFDELIDLMKKEYDVELTVLQKDVSELLMQLLTNKMIAIEDLEKKW